MTKQLTIDQAVIKLTGNSKEIKIILSHITPEHKELFNSGNATVGVLKGKILTVVIHTQWQDDFANTKWNGERFYDKNGYQGYRDDTF